MPEGANASPVQVDEREAAAGGQSRLKLPPLKDFGFYQRRKHDKWREVPAPEPALEGPVADSHAHIHMLPDPAWELARCAANGVDYACMIVDPSEDGSRPFDELEAWEAQGARLLADFSVSPQQLPQEPSCGHFESASGALLQEKASEMSAFDNVDSSDNLRKQGVDRGDDVPKAVSLTGSGQKPTRVRVAVGVHPHNAKLYDGAMEEVLRRRLADPRVGALGEIGLDYHYDLSPRDVQRRVFRRQVEVAQELGLPIALHLRGGDDPLADNAHAEAFAILREMGALGPRTLLHCCSLAPDELEPWIKADCFIAYGGALTFKNANAAREGARLVPEERLMVETDAPYMTPEPMRGAACTPAHVVFTASALAEARGVAPGAQRRAFLKRVHENTVGFYDGIQPTGGNEE